MLITLKQLKQAEASPAALKTFVETFGKEADHTEVYEKLKEQERTDWAMWLVC
ncbi:MAG: hypothetical protein GF387_01750, partial [Candidatus Portnoybacteria bacterium]|nr:hypothetical protein [Candidatus Portnoybacteria bacterium]